MSQQDDKTAELEHAEKVGLMIFPAADESAEVMEPGEEAFDFPSAAGAAESPAVLRDAMAAPIRGDHFDAVMRAQLVIERVGPTR